MKLRGSHLVAFAILAGIGGWMATGTVIVGGQESPDAITIAEREAERKTDAFRVRVVQLAATERRANLEIRGRTQASATVSVRAETGGTVQQRPVVKGQSVKSGDLLCVLSQGIRKTTMAQAEALLTQAQADFDATQQLVERGFATRSQLRQLRTALDAAKASVASAQQEMTRTEIRAAASGQLQEPFAEVGDNLSPGGVCGTLVQTNPMLFSGQVSERDIATVRPEMEAVVALVSGQKVKGKVRYIAPVADAQTRTFNIEITIPNPQGALRDGMTASANIALRPITAFQLDPNWMVLADNGQIGIRAVDTANLVTFHPITIIAQEKNAVWATGLESGLRVIALGQNFVTAGQKVQPVTEEEEKASKKGIRPKSNEVNS